MTTHRHTRKGLRSSTYITWADMLRRCAEPNNNRYNYYGGRGVTVCERWRKFENFLIDMGERPDGMTLDRIENDKGYEPGNCKWSTPREQARHRSSTKLTLDDAVEIYRCYMHGETQLSIATRFNVSPTLVSNIWHQRTWPDARNVAVMRYTLHGRERSKRKRPRWRRR